MPEERIRDDMRVRPEQYEETVNPSNPPQSTGTAPAVIAGLWYYLAPLALVILLIAFALIYWEEIARVSSNTGRADNRRG